jgi:hypothetical protein
VAVGTVVGSISSVGLALIAGVDGAIGIDSLTVAVVLDSVGAVGAVCLQARACLSANTDTVALLDVLYVLSDLDSLSDNLVADDAGWKLLVSRVVDTR